MVSSRLKIDVYDGSFNWRGRVGAPVSFVATPRHNQQSTAALTVGKRDPRAADLLAEGARVVATLDDVHFIGGPVDRVQGSGPAESATITVQITDDFCLLQDMLAWPVPTAALTAQTVEYRTITGPAETVMKTVVQENATRLGIPLTCATNLARGATITSTFRFHPIADRLLADFDAAGVGVTIRQVGAGFVLDCYTPRVYPRVLTESSRVVQSYDWDRAVFDASRVIVGGKGEGTARVFRQRVNTTLETTWKRKKEAFIDSTDVDTSADLDAKGDAHLADSGVATGLSVVLSENKSFRYNPAGGAGVRVGDKITMEVGLPTTITDILREATLSFTPDRGLFITPTIGQSRSAQDQVARALHGLARSVRDLKRR